MTSADSSMNQVLRGRASAPAGQDNPAAPADPLDQAKEIAAGLAGQIDTLRKLLTKSDTTTTTNPFAKG